MRIKWDCSIIPLQGFFLYLMPSSVHFVSFSEYIYSGVLLLLPLVGRGARLARLSVREMRLPLVSPGVIS